MYYTLLNENTTGALREKKIVGVTEGFHGSFMIAEAMMLILRDGEYPFLC